MVEKERKYIFHEVFHEIEPLVSSLLGVIILSLTIQLIDFVNLFNNNMFLNSISVFLSSNLPLFFLFFLFFSYSSYLSRTRKDAYLSISPIFGAFGVVIITWIFIKAINISNVFIGSGLLSDLLFIAKHHLFLIFCLSLTLGYICLLYTSPSPRDLSTSRMPSSA